MALPLFPHRNVINRFKWPQSKLIFILSAHFTSFVTNKKWHANHYILWSLFVFFFWLGGQFIIDCCGKKSDEHVLAKNVLDSAWLLHCHQIEMAMGMGMFSTVYEQNINKHSISWKTKKQARKQNKQMACPLF